MATPNSTPSTNLFGPTQATRVRTFVHFFKSYMSVGALLVAALPIPVASFKLIPTFEAQRKYLSVYTSMFCFLSLGFIFFQRHHLGAYMFKRPMLLNMMAQEVPRWSWIVRQMVSSAIRTFVTWLPLGCILLSVFAVFHYHGLFNDAAVVAQAQATAELEGGTFPSSFLIDIGQSDQKVALANLVIIENDRTRTAYGGENRNPTDVFSWIIINEAWTKANRYESWFEPWSSMNFVKEAQEYLRRRFALGQGDAKTEFFLAQKFIGVGAVVPTPDEVLKGKFVPFSSRLMLWYLIIFVSAETAFILMALKEYLQDLAHISDLTLMGMGGESTQWQSPSPP